MEFNMYSKQNEVPLSQMLNEILWPDHIQWQPHMTDWVVWTFHRTFATGVACRQGTLTPPDSWSRPFGTCICSTCWDQSFSRSCRYFYELCSSNIPRYFLDFASNTSVATKIPIDIIFFDIPTTVTSHISCLQRAVINACSPGNLLRSSHVVYIVLNLCIIPRHKRMGK